jgi:DNA polymerase
MASSFTTTAQSSTRSALDALNAEYEQDAAFEHLAAFSAFVPGVGSMMPRAIIIGEAPGVNEDRERTPFIGASGRVLNGLLHGIGLRREDCYITNVIKFRPPDNRTPTEEEVDAARPYLRREIAELWQERKPPPPVVLLGRVSLHLVEPGAAISNSRGLIMDRGAWRFLPVYHPAAALRNGALLNKMREDFNTLRRLIHA